LGPLSTDQHETVDELARSLVQKILHHPVTHLRKSVDRGDVDASTSVCRELFNLGDPPKAERDPGSDEGRGPQRLIKGGRDS